MLTLRLTDSLQKIFSDGPLPPARDRLFALRTERVALQACLAADAGADAVLTVETGLPVKLYAVREIPARLTVREGAKHCTLLKNGRPGPYPDLLTPLTGPVRTEPGRLTAVWIELTAAVPGAHAVRVSAETETGRTEARATVFVAKDALPPQTLLYTDWFHADCLASFYRVPVFSEEHWAIVDRFLGNAAEHGVNLILTPLFTPALDTAVGHERPTTQLVDVTLTPDGWTFGFSRLSRWIGICRKHGIGHFEFSHFFTQWGAKACPKVVADTPEGERRVFGWDTEALSPAYVGFLTALGRALTAFTDELGITENCFVHVSDEPGGDDLPQYRACAAVIQKAFGVYRHLDALSDVDFYREGLVQIPVPEEGSVDAFTAAGVKDLWTYYCCGQYENELPNRFFAMPSIRNRILGALLYKYGCAGFLHWGFNFYFTQYSLREVDPFTETDAGGAFPSGDSFTVYPGPGGEPLPSLREKVFYEGLQDLRALKALEAKIGRARTLGLLRDCLGEITFRSYPMDETRLLTLRERVYEAL